MENPCRGAWGAERSRRGCRAEMRLNPDGTYGLHFGPYSRFDIDGETVVYSDGIALPMRFASQLGPDQFERDIRHEVESQRGIE